MRDRGLIDGMVQSALAVGHETQCSNVWVCAGGCVHSMRIVWHDCVLKGESVYAYTVGITGLVLYACTVYICTVIMGTLYMVY